MPRFLLALTVTLTTLTFALALTARTWGETQPPHPALRGFVEGCEGKPQPCWYGIVPFQTTFEGVRSIAEREGWIELSPDPNKGFAWLDYLRYRVTSLSETCEFAFGSDPESDTTQVVEITLIRCPLRFADVLKAYTDINGILVRPGVDFSEVFFDQLHVVAVFDGYLTPFLEVTLYIRTYNITENMGTVTMLNWEGFKTWHEYCRGYFLYPDCMYT